MAYSLQKSWQLSLGLLILVLLGILRVSNGHPTYFKPVSRWNIAHATFYGDDTASATIGGACGYGDLFKYGYGVDTAAVSPELFDDGNGCGSCYQIMCVNSKWCNVKGGGRHGYRRPTTLIVTATNLSPPDWAQPNDPGSWHSRPKAHFDLSLPAFKKIAFSQAGIIPLQYRRVPCARKGGIRINIQGNDYWLLATVMNVGGGGDIGKMWVKGSRTGWISMSHNWGASYQAFAHLGGQCLSFKIQSYATGRTIVAYNLIPPHWSVGMTYQAKVNFS